MAINCYIEFLNNMLLFVLNRSRAAFAGQNWKTRPLHANANLLPSSICDHHSSTVASPNSAELQFKKKSKKTCRKSSDWNAKCEACSLKWKRLCQTFHHCCSPQLLRKIAYKDAYQLRLFRKSCHRYSFSLFFFLSMWWKNRSFEVMSHSMSSVDWQRYQN